MISFEHGLEPLLELAAVLRAGEQRADVERPDALALQALRDVARDDPLREPLDDRRLADARLADQHRVVLRAPREHLDHAADLLVAPDHRVELALLGELGQVAAELLERLVGALGILRRDPLAAAHLLRAPRAARRAGRRRARAAGARSRRTRRSSSLHLLLGAVEHLGERAPRRCGCCASPPSARLRAQRRLRLRAQRVGSRRRARRASAAAPGRAARAAGARDRSRGCRARRASSWAAATASWILIVSLLKSIVVSPRCRCSVGAVERRARAGTAGARRGPRRAARARAAPCARCSRRSSSSSRSTCSTPARFSPSSVVSRWIRRSRSRSASEYRRVLPGRPLRPDEPLRLVDPQRLRVHADEVGRDRDHVARAIRLRVTCPMSGQGFPCEREP